VREVIIYYFSILVKLCCSMVKHWFEGRNQFRFEFQSSNCDEFNGDEQMWMGDADGWMEV